MRLSAKLIELNKYYIDKEVSDNYAHGQLLEENSSSLCCEGVEYVNCTQLASSGLILVDVEMSFFQPVTDLFKVDGDSIVMEFLFNGGLDVDVYHLEGITGYQANTHNLTYASNYGGSFRMFPGKPMKFFIIILSKEFYYNLIPEDSLLHKEFAGNIFESNACMLSDAHLPFSPAVHSVIHEIRTCKRDGELKRLFIENKIRELLLLQLEMHQQQYILRAQAGLTGYDLLKLQEAKSILDKNFISAPGLVELSKMIFLNEFKLKKGFKACFGITVKSYVISLRMKYAMELLQKRKHIISEIAYLSGYNGLVQFSAAFKTFYGYSPKSIQCGMCDVDFADFKNCCPFCKRPVSDM